MSETEDRRLTWRLALWPVLVFVYVSAMVFVLAKAHPFSPATPAVSSAPVTLGDPYGGEIAFQESCASCHGVGGSGGGIGPALAGRSLDLATVKAQIENGSGTMPADLVEGETLADVLAYVEQIAPQ